MKLWRIAVFGFLFACGDDATTPDSAVNSDAFVSDAPDIDAVDATQDAPMNDAPTEDASTEDASINDAAFDSGGDAAVDASDAAPPRPPYPSVSLGPYPDLLAMFVRSVRSNAAALDTRSNYDQSAGQGYVLQAIGEVLWDARDHGFAERDELITLALDEIEELRASADRTTGAAPAFGLPDAWDAFGDGSTNPTFTAYTWQSGMVALGVAKIARVLDATGHPEAAAVRDFGAALVSRWDEHRTDVTDGTYWWYSTENSDAIAVHNTSVLIAMASQILGELGVAGFTMYPERAADLLWARMRGNPTIGYEWNYADDGYPTGRRRAEDVSHALVTLQFMAFARTRDWFSNSQMRGVAATLSDHMWSGHPARLHGFVDGGSGGDAEWSWSRAAVIGYAVHADAEGGDPLVYELGRSLFFSSYLSRFARDPETGVVDAARTLALAMLLAHRPDDGGESRWQVVAGQEGDDAVPRTLTEGARFYTVDWSAPSTVSGGLELPARNATAPSANMLIDIEGALPRVMVSLTYRATEGGAVEQWDGTAYQHLASLPATMSGDGQTRWMRTSFELRRDAFDYQGSVPGTNVLLRFTQRNIAVHRLEATPADE